MAPPHYDVLIVGAGISGISAAYYLQQRCPGKTFAILEGRQNIGGTWDLWRYPGIRSDSDMYTFGFSFKPWNKGWNVSPGALILEYLQEAVEEFGITRHIHFGQRVNRAAYSSADALWSLETSSGQFSCSFLFVCSGYYKYDGGHVPDWPGMDRFPNPVLKPQEWPPDLDVSGKRVLVIGSGATAASLVPALVKQKAKHVTMVQRSPTYHWAVPARDSSQWVEWLRKASPEFAHRFRRTCSTIQSVISFGVARRFPDAAAKQIIDKALQQVEDARRRFAPHIPAEDVRRHFTPRYKPWDQRICAISDGDLFVSIGSGKASCVTGTIKEFTKKGILMNSGEELETDLVVAATGFNMHDNYPMNGIEVSVDGVPYDATKTMTYRGMMLSDVPNFAYVLGYTNLSWTLRAELVCDRVCQLLKHMDSKNYHQCCPRRDPSVAEAPGGFGALMSGYLSRAKDSLPRVGVSGPWLPSPQNYLQEKWQLQRAALDEKGVEFVVGPPRSRM